MPVETPVLTEIDVRKPGYFKRQYGFWLGDKQVAAIEFKKGWSHKATFVTGDKKWDVRSCGFWSKRIELIAQQSPYTKLTLEYNWKYKINFKDSNGNWYLFKRTGVWKSCWNWIDEKGNPVMKLKSIHFSRKARGRISFFKPVTDEMYLLMLIGWFQLVNYEAQAAVAASAA